MDPSSGVLIGFGLVWLLMLLLAVATTIFWIWALVDCLMRDFHPPENKILWVLVVIFLHFLGAVLYAAIGRRQSYRR